MLRCVAIRHCTATHGCCRIDRTETETAVFCLVLLRCQDHATRSVAVVYSVLLGNSSQNSKHSLQLLNAICTARIYSHY